MRDARDLDAERLQELGDVHGRRLPFDIRVCRHDDLFDRIVLQAAQEFLDADVGRSDTL